MKALIILLAFTYLSGLLSYLIFRYSQEFENDEPADWIDYLIGIFWIALIWGMIFTAITETIIERKKDDKEFKRHKRQKDGSHY
jgi:hypothetical protein